MQRQGSSGITFINAGGSVDQLQLEGPRIVAVGSAVKQSPRVIDLRGDRLLPGLINAHDHLQLNSLVRPQYRGPYRNASEWIADVNQARTSDHALSASINAPRDARLLAGGMKNLLSGVTTVAHHDPLYPILRSAQFPTRVVTELGWSHSLHIDGEAGVRNACERTPLRWPWIIHAAEGLDSEAADELDRLAALGCLGPRTVIVHGVALDAVQRRRLADAGASLIWCPTSNLTLFGTTADVADLINAGRVTLGTDSRLTGAQDLLGELRVARELLPLGESALESLVTADAARILRLGDCGVLRPGAFADLLILPAGMPLWQATRAAVRLVMVGGSVLYADREYAALLAPDAHWADVRVDGRPKVLDAALAALLRQVGVTEAGLDLSDVAGQAA